MEAGVDNVNLSEADVVEQFAEYIVLSRTFKRMLDAATDENESETGRTSIKKEVNKSVASTMAQAATGFGL